MLKFKTKIYLFFTEDIIRHKNTLSTDTIKHKNTLSTDT